MRNYLIPATLTVFAVGLVHLIASAPVAHPQSQPSQFHLQEATIDDIQQAIRSGQITCQQVVQWYINRAKAYNGPGTRLVTEDMAPGIFPKYSEYKAAVEKTADLLVGDPRKTVPLEFGRMEPTATDPTVKQQYGWIEGVPNSPRTSALATINLRGQRSVTCKGDLDQKDDPPGTPKVCSELAKLPDALEQAAALDATYGSNPDLEKLPMYCVVFSFKDSFDTKDMHSNAGADAHYDIDFPARDHTVVNELRAKGAIIYAKSVTSEYNGLGGDPGGKNFETKHLNLEMYSRSTWAGNPSNVYDTTRAPSMGSSSGSAVSVSSNMVTIGICEETRQSCRGPANHNSLALILPAKALVSFLGGGIGSDIYNDRTGIHCRKIADCTKVLDAIKDPANGYYDSRDIFTTLPRSYYPSEPYVTAITAGTPGALRGMRIGIVREFMVKWTKADEPVVDAVDAQMKEMLGNQLGATLVQSVTPGWNDDPDMEKMTTTFDDAIRQIVPVLYPDLLFHLNAKGEPMFPDFAVKIKPIKFAPGVIRGTGTLSAADWMIRWADGLEPTPYNLNLRSLFGLADSNTFRFHIDQYLYRRAKDWADRGYTEGLVDWPTLNARSKFYSDHQRAAFKNWEEVTDLREPLNERQGIAERIQLRELLQRVVMKVIEENKLDILINVHDQLPPGKIGLAPEPTINDRTQTFPLGPDLGWTEVLIPAGYVQTVYDPTFELRTDSHGRKFYGSKTSTVPTALAPPGLPYSISFWCEPGMERRSLKAASAYESASKRRIPPPAFGPIPGEP
jgi:Asp-tRNA(Asn)/Glu-tRNA(Gln) amidotransferase A subunit family amidase